MSVVILAIVSFSLAGSAQAAGHGGHMNDTDGKLSQKLSGNAPAAGTCGVMKDAYKALDCCGAPRNKVTNLQLVPMNAHMSNSSNPCEGKKNLTQPDLANTECIVDGVVLAMEQSGSNVTRGYVGTLNTSAVPINTSYFSKQMCPVNVHWHLGAEHYSVGEYDETGTGPKLDEFHFVAASDSQNDRRLAESALMGFRCNHYNADDMKFSKPYVWQHCVDMHLGETYEVHWPHSTLGACTSPFQFQTPFYDGVFCNAPENIMEMVKDGSVKTWENIGVQAQVFTIVNDERYYFPDLFRGAIVDDAHWEDVAYYTGSTTGTSRNNKMCSAYTPITWQVDRRCHLISASSFDKMCADMKSQHDDMSGDIHPHGSRVLPWQNLTANNHQRRV